MANELQKQTGASTPATNPIEELSLSRLISQDSFKKRFEQVLGNRSNVFTSSLISIVNQSDKLKKAEPLSVVQCGLMAATLDLPINPNLGFAYIIPYDQSYKDGNGNWQKRTVAQFQIGYKGIIQLAQRSNQLKLVNATDVREGEIKTNDRLTGLIEFEWIESYAERSKKKIIGFAGYFQLNSGFSKTLYMTVEQMKEHGLKYSQSFKSEKTRESSLWSTNFESMGGKTVLKLLLSKYAPLSVELEKAFAADQAVINDAETMDVDYIDANAEPMGIDDVSDFKEQKRVEDFISNAKTVEELSTIDRSIVDKYGYTVQFDAKEKELNQKKAGETKSLSDLAKEASKK